MTNTPPVLLSSFATWRADQPSNASDDLLDLWSEGAEDAHLVRMLRQLPVDTQQASDRIIATIERERPTAVLCCGMAEKRTHLELETRATSAEDVLYSTASVAAWSQGLPQTRLSHDAGSFVCNGTYYRVLQWLRDRQRQARQQPVPCTFIHVPRLTAANTAAILNDFNAIVRAAIGSLSLPHRFSSADGDD